MSCTFIWEKMQRLIFWFCATLHIGRYLDNRTGCIFGNKIRKYLQAPFGCHPRCIFDSSLLIGLHLISIFISAASASMNAVIFAHNGQIVRLFHQPDSFSVFCIQISHNSSKLQEMLVLHIICTHCSTHTTHNDRNTYFI